MSGGHHQRVQLPLLILLTLFATPKTRAELHLRHIKPVVPILLLVIFIQRQILISAARLGDILVP